MGLGIIVILAAAAFVALDLKDLAIGLACIWLGLSM